MVPTRAPILAAIYSPDAERAARHSGSTVPAVATRQFSITSPAEQAAIASVRDFYSVSAISPSARTYSNYVEPRNYQHSQTFADAEQWEAATQSELQCFIDMGVIDPCNYQDIPPDMYEAD